MGTPTERLMGVLKVSHWEVDLVKYWVKSWATYWVKLMGQLTAKCSVQKTEQNLVPRSLQLHCSESQSGIF